VGATENYAKTLNTLFLDSLYKDNEVTPGQTPEGAVLVHGIVNNIGFNPERLNKNKDKILELAKAIVTDPFLKEGGGGMSFLQLCEDRNGLQWGEHRNMEQLVLLCIGLKKAVYCLPREAWVALPGGMPYIMFDLN